MIDPTGHVVHYNPGEPDDYDDPHERLMAAAPAMLAALKVIHAVCVERSEAGQRGDWDGLALEASLAIEKAEGQ